MCTVGYSLAVGLSERLVRMTFSEAYLLKWSVDKARDSVRGDNIWGCLQTGVIRSPGVMISVDERI